MLLSVILALNLRIFVGNGPFALTLPQGLFVSNKAIRVFNKEFARYPRLTPARFSLAAIDDPLSPRYYTLDDFDRLFTIHWWTKYFSALGVSRIYPQLVLTQPLISGSSRYIAGYASTTCAFGHSTPVAIANVTAVNALGVGRLTHDAYALLHEFLHLLGARHESRSGSVMLANPLPELVENRRKPLRVTMNTKLQIMRCVS